MQILNACLRALVVLALCSALMAHAQSRTGGPPPAIPGMSPNNSTANGPEPDPSLRHMTEQMAIKRNSDRQRQIVNDTAHLLQLAQELNEEVGKSTKDQLSVSVVKKADEIEKLAKTIKDKMRDGQ